MSELSEAIRRQVRERAGNRCEYCLSHQDYVMGRLQIDHIQPVAKGGSDGNDGPIILYGGQRVRKSPASPLAAV